MNTFCFKKLNVKYNTKYNSRDSFKFAQVTMTFILIQKPPINQIKV